MRGAWARLAAATGWPALFGTGFVAADFGLAAAFMRLKIEGLPVAGAGLCASAGLTTKAEMSSKVPSLAFIFRLLAFDKG